MWIRITPQLWWLQPQHCGHITWCGLQFKSLVGGLIGRYIVNQWEECTGRGNGHWREGTGLLQRKTPISPMLSLIYTGGNWQQKTLLLMNLFRTLEKYKRKEIWQKKKVDLFKQDIITSICILLLVKLELYIQF